MEERPPHFADCARCATSRRIAPVRFVLLAVISREEAVRSIRSLAALTHEWSASGSAAADRAAECAAIHRGACVEKLRRLVVSPLMQDAGTATFPTCRNP